RRVRVRGSAASVVIDRLSLYSRCIRE
uniref:Uncharacterized protein n=1 Tax=Amphimedon queenslandica TaxID=400682 RepID=A0A1X7VHY3_AMPQE